MMVIYDRKWISKMIVSGPIWVQLPSFEGQNRQLYIYTIWTAVMAGVWFLAGRLPYIFLTLGSFPCWHTPAAHRSPLWDDSCLTQAGHAMIEKHPFAVCIRRAFVEAVCLVGRVLQGNLNAVKESKVWEVQYQMYAKNWSFFGGLTAAYFN